MNDTKPWFASRTLWVNAIALVATLALANGLDLGLTAETQAEIVAGVLAAVNIVLRFRTNQAVTK
jgi:hypothetical protein